MILYLQENDMFENGDSENEEFDPVFISSIIKKKKAGRKKLSMI